MVVLDHEENAMVNAPPCPYCGNPARLVSGREVYPHRRDLAARRYWRCEPCDARTGADWNKGFAPSGRLADAALRAAHAEAHRAFDPIWKTREMTQGEAYRWLAGELGLPKAVVRIGFMDAALCRRVVEACQRRQPRAAE
jgi:hypothetical protein